MRLRRPRYQPLAEHELSARQSEVLGALGASRRGLNIYRTAARAPDALEALLDVGRYISSELSALAPREREIVILRTAHGCRSGYVWTQHVVLGGRAGLSEGQIEALKLGPQHSVWTPADRALVGACDELLADQFISERTWSALTQWFDDKQRMDLVFTAGHYMQVAMIVNTFGVQLEPGRTLDPDLARLSDR